MCYKIVYLYITPANSNKTGKVLTGTIRLKAGSITKEIRVSQLSKSSNRLASLGKVIYTFNEFADIDNRSETVVKPRVATTT